MFTRSALCLVSSLLFVACSSSTPSADSASDGSPSSGKSDHKICQGDTAQDSETTVYNKEKFPVMNLTVDDEAYKITCDCYRGGGDPGDEGIVDVIRLSDKQKVGEFFVQHGIAGRRLVIYKDGDGNRVTAKISVADIYAAYEKAGGTCYDLHPGMKTYEFGAG